MENESFLVTETQNGEEKVIGEFPDVFCAFKLLRTYTEEDIQKLSPCVYKKFADGHISTEF